MEELRNSIHKLHSNAMGYDNIHNKMLMNLNPINQIQLLHLFNVCYAESFCPPEWKQSKIIPLLKAGKDKKELSSYRPIALTSCLGKCFERLVNARLYWHMEHFNLIPKAQAVFRKECSTQDHIWNLETRIKLGFNYNKSTTCVFLDLAKAYDTVWIPGLLYKLCKTRVSGNLLKWIKVS